MKHARKDYDRIQDPLNKIPDDEPVFLLRAKDQLAPALLKIWAHNLVVAGGQEEMAQLVSNHADRMIEWQHIHGCKIPDMEFPQK